MNLHFQYPLSPLPSPPSTSSSHPSNKYGSRLDSLRALAEGSKFQVPTTLVRNRDLHLVSLGNFKPSSDRNVMQLRVDPTSSAPPSSNIRRRQWKLEMGKVVSMRMHVRWREVGPGPTHSAQNPFSISCDLRTYRHRHLPPPSLSSSLPTTTLFGNECKRLNWKLAHPDVNMQLAPR